MANIVKFINKRTFFRTLACCCGHGRYPPTIVIEDSDGNNREIFSDIVIPRKRLFYHKDEDGYYFITEVLKKDMSK